MNGEDDVYALKTTFSESLNKKMADWRDQTFIKFSPPDIKKVEFNYPGDSSFVLTKGEFDWQIDGEKVDSLQDAHIQDYLRVVSNLNLSSFEDKINPGGDPFYTLNIEGDNIQPIQIRAFKGQKTDEFLLKSTLNTKALFKENIEGEFKKVFKGKGDF